MRDRGIYGQWDASDDISKESNHQQKIKQSVWAEEIETLTPQAEVWCRKEEHSSMRFNLGSSSNHSGEEGDASISQVHGYMSLCELCDTQWGLHHQSLLLVYSKSTRDYMGSTGMGSPELHDISCMWWYTHQLCLCNWCFWPASKEFHYCYGI